MPRYVMPRYLAVRWEQRTTVGSKYPADNNRWLVVDCGNAVVMAEAVSGDQARTIARALEAGTLGATS